MRFSYRKEKSHLFGEIHRPVVEIEFFDDDKNAPISVFAYLDSGADISLIPRSTGELLGFEVIRDKIKEIKAIGGGKVPVIIKETNIRLCDLKFRCRIAWSLLEDVPHLLGRMDVFENFNIQFHENEKYVEIVRMDIGNTEDNP